MTDVPTSVVRTRKPRGQGAARRGEILAAATRIFIDEGFPNTTMRRIAAAVGVSTTALYVYFPDKNAILTAIAEHSFAALLEALEASQGAATPAERFAAGLRAYIGFGRRHQDEYRLIFLGRPPGQGPDPCPEILSADLSFAILRRGVEEMMQAGLFRPGPPGAAAEAIWCCLHGVTSLLLNQAEHLETPPDVLVQKVIDMVMAGHR